MAPLSRAQTAGSAGANSLERATIATVPPPFAAYLRVYEPLSALPAAEQAHWRQYVTAGRAPARAQAPRLEHEHALRRLLSGRLPDPGEHAFVAGGDGVPQICPWRTALRAWESAEEFTAGMADQLADAFLPRATAARASAELASWRVGHPQSRSHIVTATWTVPVRWFALFSSEERQLHLDHGRRELVFVTSMGQARRRAARALARSRKGLGETPMTMAMEELARWLEDFHPRSRVELDYGGLVWLFTVAQLRDDDSVADVATSLDALAAGDGAAAGAAYDRVSERWRPAQLAQNAN